MTKKTTRSKTKEKVRKITKGYSNNQDKGLVKSHYSLKELLDFETLSTGLSSRFINLPDNEVDKEIENGLKKIVEFLGVGEGSLTEFSEDRTRLITTHSYAIAEIKPRLPELPEYIDKKFPWQAEKLRSGNVIRYTKLPDDLPKNAKNEREFCLKVGLRSFLSIPLTVGGSILGAISFGSYRFRHSWPDDIVKRLQLVGEIFSNALARRRSEIELKKSLSEIRKLKKQLETENIYLREEIELQFNHDEIIGKSKAIKSVLSKVERVSITNSTVLIYGETGTGKELLARAIHKLSKRNGHAMVKVNCAALPPTLVESELFGYEKGAFTGAYSSQIGRFEIAHNSTIFLDEISEMSSSLQAKLLRVLEEGEFERLGSGKTRKMDVRVIAATNRHMEKEVSDGNFREDLYYRLYVFPIHVPPLRERREDIPLLVSRFLIELGKNMGKRVEKISKHSMEALQRYHWPAINGTGRPPSKVMCLP